MRKEEHNKLQKILQETEKYMADHPGLDGAALTQHTTAVAILQKILKDFPVDPHQPIGYEIVPVIEPPTEKGYYIGIIAGGLREVSYQPAHKSWICRHKVTDEVTHWLRPVFTPERTDALEAADINDKARIYAMNPELRHYDGFNNAVRGYEAGYNACLASRTESVEIDPTNESMGMNAARHWKKKHDDLLASRNGYTRTQMKESYEEAWRKCNDSLGGFNIDENWRDESFEEFMSSLTTSNQNT